MRPWTKTCCKVTPSPAMRLTWKAKSSISSNFNFEIVTGAPLTDGMGWLLGRYSNLWMKLEALNLVLVSRSRVFGKTLRSQFRWRCSAPRSTSPRSILLPRRGSRRDFSPTRSRARASSSLPKGRGDAPGARSRSRRISVTSWSRSTVLERQASGAHRAIWRGCR